jgi:hypothetical protein
LTRQAAQKGAIEAIDLVLAPSDFWKVNFQERLERLLKDEDKFPGDSYTCEETIIEISIERSRQRGLTKRCKKLGIDWQLVDEHLEGLGDLFSKREEDNLQHGVCLQGSYS